MRNEIDTSLDDDLKDDLGDNEEASLDDEFSGNDMSKKAMVHRATSRRRDIERLLEERRLKEELQDFFQ